MPDISGTTRAQTLFLRSFRTAPAGPAPADWPSPAILRKWLRRPAFRKALETVREALRFQSDFQLADAATRAARKLCTDDSALTPHDLGQLLRLSHLRQRFPAAPANPTESEKQTTADDEEDDYPIGFPRREIVRELDEELFKKTAFQRGYASPLREWPGFPRPVPQDAFYCRLIQEPGALLWYLKLYDQEGNDHRFQPILLSCKHLIPDDHPDRPLPRFQPPAPGAPT